MKTLAREHLLEGDKGKTRSEEIVALHRAGARTARDRETNRYQPTRRAQMVPALGTASRSLLTCAKTTG